MKRRDVILMLLPASVLVLLAILVTLLVVQFKGFERSYLEDAKDDLRLRTHLIADTLGPALRAGDRVEVARRCSTFHDHPTRVTVIDVTGRVIADSNATAENLSNHLGRPELHDVQDEGSFVSRYSVTTQAWLLYYAVRIDGYYVRVSMPMSAVARTLDHAKGSVAVALILGAGLILAMTLYLFLRVRPHFIALQAAAVAIARGHLETPIAVPQGGILRELAQAVATMSRQLRQRIGDLQRERNEFDALFNTLREPLLVVSHTGTVLQRNRAASQLFALSIDASDFRIERTACPDLITYVREAFSSATVQGREIVLETATQPRTLLAHAVRLERDGELCLLLLLTDLTDLRRLESFRSDFVANVSHEIKTPLTAILSTVEMLRDTPTLDDLQKKQCMNILQRQSQRLNELVLDILSLASIERRQGQGGKTFLPVRLDVLLRDAVALCADGADYAGVDVHLVEPMPELSLFGDPRLLEQAIANLIVNAVKHSGAKQVEVILQANADVALVRVRDEGCGIAPEHLSRLFERFYRVHKERSRATGGTGLGLAIVKHIALLHHGTIEVNSSLGKGSEFILTLPRMSAKS
ncbi:MAG: ATP-binding protein [Kiritimatiellia bacterium]